MNTKYAKNLDVKIFIFTISDFWPRRLVKTLHIAEFTPAKTMHMAVS